MLLLLLLLWGMGPSHRSLRLSTPLGEEGMLLMLRLRASSSSAAPSKLLIVETLVGEGAVHATPRPPQMLLVLMLLMLSPYSHRVRRSATTGGSRGNGLH